MLFSKCFPPTSSTLLSSNGLLKPCVYNGKQNTAFQKIYSNIFGYRCYFLCYSKMMLEKPLASTLTKETKTACRCSFLILCKNIKRIIFIL